MDRGIKNKLADIDEILAKSQRLTTHNGFTGSSPSGSRNVSRGVAELTEFSKQWAKESVNDQGNLDAFRLLSQKNFDAKKLFEDVNAIQVKTADDSSMRLEGTDIEGYLAHQHDMIILTAIEEAKQGAEDHIQEMQRKWAANEWAQARHKFMESLGHRAYRWEGQVAPTPAKDFSNAPQSHPATGGAPFSPTPQKGAGLFSPQSGARLKPGYGSSVAMLDSRPPLSDLLSSQAAVIRRLNLSSHSSAHLGGAAVGADGSTAGNREPVPAPGSVKPYAQLAACVRVPEQAGGRALVSDGLNKAEMLAYKAHLQLLASMVGETNVQRSSASSARDVLVSSTSTRQVPATFISAPGESGVPPAGYFSGLCLDPTDFSHAAASSQFQAAEERRQWLSQGAKSYLEVQYWDVLSHSLDEAVQRDGWQMLSSAEGYSRQQRLRSYVAYLQHSRQLPAQCARILATSASTATSAQEPMSPATPMQRYRSTSTANSATNAQPTPLWVFVYHCLRVGDLAAVTAELSASMTRGHCEGGGAALTVLQTMLQLQTPPATTRQSRASSVTLPEHEARALVDAMQQCRAQFERESHSDDATCDPYRQLVFNLLGLASKEDLASNAIPGFSLEDFLWSNLWFVQYVRLLQPSVGAGAFATPLSANERGLFELILEYGGPDYFDEDRSNPFRYAMVLCCCQRFGDAVAHLWQSNKILPAVHLASAALHYGLVLPHVPLDMNPSHPMIMGGRFMNGSSFATSQDPTPASVLQFFGSTPLLMAYPAIVTDYLVSLDSNWLSHAQGLEPEVKEALKMKSQAVVSGVLESFIVSLPREQLADVVGAPVDSKQGRDAARTAGARLDDYLPNTQIELLLARSAYHLLTQRQEAEAAIYLYLLAGRYCEVVEELCTQLANVLVPQVHPVTKQRLQSHEVVRRHWQEVAENFIARYLHTGDGQPHAGGDSAVIHALTLSGNRGLADTLIVLTLLFPFVDAAVGGVEGGATQALKLLDRLELLPVSEQQVDAATSYSTLLRPVMDDLLLMAMESTAKAHQAVQIERNRASSTSSGAGHFSGLLTDRDIQLQGLKQRAGALASFALKIKTRLNRPDTAGLLARMESSIV